MTYWDHVLIANTPLFIGSNNRLPDAIFGTPEMRQMYLRRVRTLMDELLKPAHGGGQPASPLQPRVRPAAASRPAANSIAAAAEALHYEPRIDELAAQIAPDAALDDAKWNSHAWGNGSTAPNYPSRCGGRRGTERLLSARTPATVVQRPGLRGERIPGPQPAGTIVLFTAVEASPSSGNQDEEYLQLRNPNSFAVDISGWTLSTAGNTQAPIFTFRGGTVIPAGGTLYVAANRPAFRARRSVSHRRPGPVRRRRLHRPAPRRSMTLALTDRQGVTVAVISR